MIIEARKNPNGMNAVQVIEVIKDLAKSQGFYSRMWQNIQENILTDEEEILEPAALLRRVYPHLMQITFSKNEQKYQGEIQKVQMQERTPLELFDSFLEEVRGEKEKTRSDYMKMLLEEMEEDL